MYVVPSGLFVEEAHSIKKDDHQGSRKMRFLLELSIPST